MSNIYKYFVYNILFFAVIPSASSQSMQEIQKMRAEYEKYKKGELDFNENISLDNEDSDIFGIPKSAVFTPYKPNIDLSDTLDNIDKFFGYDFFTVRDTLKFWENLPTPKDYLLGPGDELIISLWGETQLRENYTISRDGSIYD